MQTRCIVKGEAQKNPLFWRFSGGFWIYQDRLFSRNSTRKPLNLIKSPIFTNAPCKSTCLYNAPSMHIVDRNPQNFLQATPQKEFEKGLQKRFPRSYPCEVLLFGAFCPLLSSAEKKVPTGCFCSLGSCFGCLLLDSRRIQSLTSIGFTSDAQRLSTSSGKKWHLYFEFCRVFVVFPFFVVSCECFLWCAITICPKTLSLQHLSFGQLILSTIM